MHFIFLGRFSIRCGSKFRAEVAYLEVGSSDLEQIHEKNIFDEIPALFVLYLCFIYIYIN